MSETGPTAADFEAIEVYDPNGPHAAQELELLQHLVDLGASLDDLAEYRGELAGLASVVALRGERALTLSEAAARSGVGEEKLLAISRAAGFPQPGPRDRVFAEQFADLAAGLTPAEAVFGQEAVLQLVRVMGSTMGRLADAIVSAFLVNVEPGVIAGGPRGAQGRPRERRGVRLLPSRADRPLRARGDRGVGPAASNQSGYSSFRHARGSSEWGCGVRASRNEWYGATNGSGAITV